MSMTFTVYAGPMIPLRKGDNTDYDALTDMRLRVLFLEDGERAVVVSEDYEIFGRPCFLSRDRTFCVIEPDFIDEEMARFFKWLESNGDDDRLNDNYLHWNDEAKWAIVPFLY